jgi:hypothetical protein
MTVSENGITLNFPTDLVFQLDQCAGYLQLKSHSVKEMDVCWFDREENTLWSIEMKSFTNLAGHPQYNEQDVSRRNILDYWLTELYNKTIHTLCMLETNRSGTKDCRLEGITDTTKYKLIHLLHVKGGQEEYLQQMQDELRSKLKPFLAIFRSTVAIVPYSQTKNGEILPWVN